MMIRVTSIPPTIPALEPPVSISTFWIEGSASGLSSKEDLDKASVEAEEEDEDEEEEEEEDVVLGLAVEAVLEDDNIVSEGIVG